MTVIKARKEPYHADARTSSCQIPKRLVYSIESVSQMNTGGPSDLLAIVLLLELSVVYYLICDAIVFLVETTLTI